MKISEAVLDKGRCCHDRLILYSRHIGGGMDMIRQEREGVSAAFAEIIQSLLDSETRELREALKRYGNHDSGCNYVDSDLRNPLPCNCGFDAALSKAGAE